MASAASASPASAPSSISTHTNSFQSQLLSPNSPISRPLSPNLSISHPLSPNSFVSRPLPPNSPLSRPLPPSNSPTLNKKLPRLPSFEILDIPSFDSITDLDTRLSLPDPSTTFKLDSSPLTTASTATPTASTPTSHRFRFGRSKSSQRSKSWLTGSRKEQDAKVTQHLEPPSRNGDTPRPSLSERSQSATDTLASFARRPWIARTPSPKVENTPDNASDKTPKPAKPSPQLQNGMTSALGKTAGYFTRAKPKPPALITQQDWGADSDSCASSSASQTGQHSLTSRTSQSTSSDSNVTPITDDSCNELTRQVRDSLWSSFKTLELEFKSFTLKQMTQRISQIQTILLPFLRSTMYHPSTKKVQPEDIDRRAVILSKWWNGILDMLDSQANQPIPGVDRPILLEAATMIMMRPEWRQTTTYFQALADRSPKEKVSAPSRTPDSNRFSILAETAEQNVRTMFITNLVRQMSIVVEKMSLRHAPLTLVNFAGKTCAYAFFFAPGVADILIRLWGLTPELIRRTADEFGLPRCDDGDSEDIVAFFPPRLGPYGWISPRAAWNRLKQIPKMSVSVAQIPWTGPWVSRWKGRDTDLFFIFCKYFHVMTDQFLLPGLPQELRARAPAFVLVQAQLLSVIDSTIHRHAALGPIYHPPLVDSIHGVDASAMAMPMPPSNLMKNMSDNRLVALLKDFLTDDFPEFARAQATFAETFAALLKAAALRTSKFDNSACFTLCDFLEEVFVIYDKYETEQHVTTHIDWSFWFEVMKRMISSLNTMSEVRTLSFLYSIWNVATRQSSRKAELCFDWLLTEDAFNLFFNNWCPMVRAYYQRLLCWRICRFDGSLSDVDMAVFRLVGERLKSVWSHYLYLKESAEEAGRARPSSTPMSPAVGKRFIIIRQEVHPPQPGLVLGLDTFARAPSGSDLVGMGDYIDSQLSKGDGKKRWSLLGKVLSLTNVNLADSTNRFADDAMAQCEAGETRRPCTQSSTQSSKRFHFGGSSSDSESCASSPLMDEPGYIFKFLLAWQQNMGPGRERVLSAPQLPGPAQHRISGSLLGRPALGEMRKISNSSQAGLVDRARNATPLGSPANEGMRSFLVEESLQVDKSSLPSPLPTLRMPSPSAESDATRTVTPSSGCQAEEVVQGRKPTGVYKNNAVYSGQALAEWIQVVSECNSFVDRRTDEGVDRLCDMEVPLLSVEGFRKQ